MLIDDANGSIRLADFGNAKDLQVCYMEELMILSPLSDLLSPLLLPFNYLHLQLPLCQQVIEL